MVAPAENITSLMNEMMELYRQGKYIEAFERVEEQSANFPEEQGRIVFSQACLLSMAGRKEQAIDWLRKGLEQGLWWQQDMFLDPDFDNVREEEEFKQLVQHSQERLEAARQIIKPARSVLVPDRKTEKYPLVIALHGHSANKSSNVDKWQLACDRGWLVLVPQSNNAIFPGAYRWDDPEQGGREILFHYEDILAKYPIDRGRILLSGFSQGSGMALITALSGKIPACGFIGVGTWWADLEQVQQLAASAPRKLRAYFITGEKDGTLERSREMQNALRKNGHAVEEEVHSDLGHEFPTDFAASFEQATAFILEEDQ